MNTTPTTPPEDGAAPARQCWCVINHPVTDEERAELANAIDYARDIGDLEALPLLLARLTGPCPARS
ncbi:hypothetical protein OG426_30560 [Streptomyces canus]|uniref:hypothetical protein n=1 Tax=Streptomyces canus TaxID=58343 RepID=UPI002257FD44|nr:hypothetical protein [Streptomyces canus]MCX4858305.1 hypothetical protein [Streptomyces canus]WSW36477.1 hypothetical protein OG426_30560 [Streptomyces canus]